MNTPAVKIENLVKRYKELVAVDHLNLEIREGEVFGLLGPNGSGGVVFGGGELVFSHGGGVLQGGLEGFTADPLQVQGLGGGFGISFAADTAILGRSNGKLQVCSFVNRCPGLVVNIRGGRFRGGGAGGGGIRGTAEQAEDHAGRQQQGE